MHEGHKTKLLNCDLCVAFGSCVLKFFPVIQIGNVRNLNDFTIGQFYQVKITDAEAFDLYGEIV